MQQNNHTQRETVPDEAVHHGFEDIEKIAGTILDARDILERKSTDDAGALYDKMAGFIVRLLESSMLMLFKYPTCAVRT